MMIQRGFLLSLSLTFLLLPGCGPATAPNSTPTGSQTAAKKVSDFQDQVLVADLTLFSKDSSGKISPLSPEAITSLKSGATTLSNKDIKLPGAAEKDPLLTSEAAKVEWLSKVVNGQPQVAYLGGGTYRSFVSKTSKSNVLSVQLKGQSNPHQIYTPADLEAAEMVLSPDGKVEGMMGMSADFQLKQAKPLPLILLTSFSDRQYSRVRSRREMRANGVLLLLPLVTQYGFRPTSEADSPYGMMSLMSFKPGDSAGGDAFVLGEPQASTPEVKASAEGIEQENEDLLALDEDPKSKLLLEIAGRWKPESPLVSTLAGGDVILDLALATLTKFSASVEVGTAKYSASGDMPALEVAGSDTLNVSFTEGGRNLKTEIKVLGPNRLSVTLKSATGAPELQGIVNQAFILNRAL